MAESSRTEQENNYYWDGEYPRYDRGGRLDTVVEETKGEEEGDIVEAEEDEKEIAVTRAVDVGEDSLEADGEGKESP